MKLSEKITQAMLEGQVRDFSDAYQGAMEEVAIWKRRALEAETLNRKFIAGINGPMRMGEPAQPAQKAVAYLDLGVGGYMDIGTDLTDEQLASLPKGRHMLGIVGTYGVDGYVSAQPGAQSKLDEIKIALHRALELGKRETWTGAKKYRSREDQREEQQCWDRVWNLLGAKGE